SWDATKLSSLHINNDTTIDGGSKPILVFGGITIAKGAVLNIAAGTILYFNSDAGIDVYGRLDIPGSSDKNVVIRGSRLDRMFNYLPYDRMSGQWKGIHFYESSYNNSIKYCDIHSAFNGVVCDSSDVDKIKLNIEESTIHNCQGYGLKSINSNIVALNSQITNTLNNCIYIDGGNALINACTIAQFYPFDSNRGAAFCFLSNHSLKSMSVYNSIITGYADDQLYGFKSEGKDFNYKFSNSIIRTPVVVTSDSAYFKNVIYESTVNAETVGKNHFFKIDADNQYYDFHLSDKSAAIDKADKITAPTLDRNGKNRIGIPDVGAYEY
ncbi:MAG: right-handed parallel beta-helix repeat-containing protein, partial [Prevotella sp.]|nr:right-handed parallel beta-helix repeat-containing protein [Prevotella sp.]